MFDVLASEINVAGEAALKSPTALAAVRAISETCGSLPLHVFSRGANGERERDRKHPGDALLNVKANPWTGAYGLRTVLVKDALLYGRGLAVAVRRGKKVTEFHRVMPGAGSADCSGPEPVYKITMRDGTAKHYGWRDVVDVLTPGGTIDQPINLTTLARDAIRADVLMSRYFSKLLSGGARPSAIFSAQTPVKPADWDEMKKWLLEQTKEDGTIFLPAPFNFEQLTFSSVDLEFNARAATVKNEIAAAYRVPPTAVQDYARATWSNSAEMGQQFLQSLLPWLASVEWAFSRVLIDDDSFLEHQTFELTKPNIVQLFAAIRQAAGGATMTPNEARAIALNLPPIDGGETLIRQAGQSTTADPANPQT